MAWEFVSCGRFCPSFENLSLVGEQLQALREPESRPMLSLFSSAIVFDISDQFRLVQWVNNDQRVQNLPEGPGWGRGLGITGRVKSSRQWSVLGVVCLPLPSSSFNAKDSKIAA